MVLSFAYGLGTGSSDTVVLFEIQIHLDTTMFIVQAGPHCKRDFVCG